LGFPSGIILKLLSLDENGTIVLRIRETAMVSFID
jgi:hypothetical protein